MTQISRAYLVNSGQSILTYPPAGVAFLAGVCERVGVEYETLDLNLEFFKYTNQDTWDQVFLHITLGRPLQDLPSDLLLKVDNFLDHAVERVCNYAPDCVAVSLLTYVQQYWAERFWSKLRPRYSGMIIAGGSGVSVPGVAEKTNSLTFGEDMVRKDLVDYYCLGEGDLIVEEFLQGHRDMPGLNHVGVHNSWQPQLDDLDQFATPSYQKISFDGYYPVEGRPNTNDKKYLISLTGSRGCVRRCSFCDIGHLWKKFRYRSGPNIADEILKHHLDIGATDFWFTDSLINGSLKQFNDLMNRLIEHRQRVPTLQDLRYNGQFIIRPRSDHPEKLFRSLSESGCNRLSIGIESGSESVRDHMGKKFSNADIDWHFEMCEKYQIKNWILLITGYPTETEQDHQDTLDMLIKNQKYIVNHTILGINLQHTMALLPNSPIANMPELALHFHDSSGGTYGAYTNWLAESNPTLTLARRYQRFAELAETSIKLRYSLPAEIIYFLQQHTESALGENQIPIISESSILS
jgi:radical SAM superfamily enzyme YgiQ (UPF0313 family)